MTELSAKTEEQLAGLDDDRDVRALLDLRQKHLTEFVAGNRERTRSRRRDPHP